LCGGGSSRGGLRPLDIKPLLREVFLNSPFFFVEINLLLLCGDVPQI